MNYLFIRIPKLLSLMLAAVCLSAGVSAQITSSTSGSNNGKPEEAARAEARIRQITNDSGRYFNQGLLYLEENSRTKAREDFDKSVEVFLMSGVNVQRNDRLRECYNQLIETVYRMEFPATQRPVNIRGLSAMCGWEIKSELADSIALLVTKSAASPDASDVANAIAGNTSSDSDDDIFGFSDQGFEPSPLDELSKLQLTEDENNVDTP
jgi:hypothetical protein